MILWQTIPIFNCKKMALAIKKMPFGLSNYPPAMFISLALPERVENYKTLVQEST